MKAFANCGLLATTTQRAWLFACAEAFTLSRGMIGRPTIAMGNFMPTEILNRHLFIIR
jgi:hypothetical protein